MKNVLFLVLSFLFIQSATAQNVSATSCNTSFFVSSNAQALIDSYRDLITKTGVTNCVYDATNNYDCVTSAMASKGYNNGFYEGSGSKKVYGYVNFTSYVNRTHPSAVEKNAFHSMWAGKSLPDAAGYSALICPEAIPAIVVYPFSMGAQNHVFEAIFVNPATYKSATAKTFLALKNVAIKPETIKAINEVYMACPSDYIAQTDNVAYQNPLSSKGILCDLTLTNGSKVTAYIINNYDGGGTLLWKQKKQ
jgi:hypothetical protein